MNDSTTVRHTAPHHPTFSIPQVFDFVKSTSERQFRVILRRILPDSAVPVLRHLRFRVHKIRIIRDDLGRVVLDAVLFPRSRLDRADNTDGACLAEIAGDKLSRLSPCRYVKKVCLRFFAVLAAESTVDRHSERRHRNAGRRGIEFRISGQSAAEDYFVKVEVRNKSSLFSIFLIAA